MINAEAMFWGLDLAGSVVPGSNPVLSSTPTFGAGKTSFVTPNQLMLQGDVNTWDYTADDGDSHVTPMAVFGDGDLVVEPLGRYQNARIWYHRDG